MASPPTTTSILAFEYTTIMIISIYFLCKHWHFTNKTIKKKICQMIFLHLMADCINYYTCYPFTPVGKKGKLVPCRRILICDSFQVQFSQWQSESNRKFFARTLCGYNEMAVVRQTILLPLTISCYSWIDDLQLKLNFSNQQDCFKSIYTTSVKFIVNLTMN